ncbi:MAG: hypothetical protein CUN57_01460 [Phototrophicales bacterium]|nr:MAG: hypothetical protein CUN57_01460 [Phototrophicales bacterium]
MRNQLNAFIAMPLQMEEQLARKSQGLSLEQYDALPGTRQWLGILSDASLSKSCVIALYRLENLVNNVYRDLEIESRK